MRGHDVLAGADTGGGLLSRARGSVLEVRAGLDLAGCQPVDTVVCQLVLCTVADQAATIAELHRLLLPDGQLLFIEHVLARTPLARVQRAVGPVWARAPGGCHPDRDTISALRAGGFVITDCARPAPFGRLAAGAIVVGHAVLRKEP